MDELTNFRKTLGELKNFLASPVKDKRDQAGIIKGFEFTFEQAWKAIQKVAGKQGTEIGNPKRAFTYALQNHWTAAQDEKKWIQLLKDRNLTTHTYEEDIATEILERISRDYVSLFEGLLTALEKEIKSL